jgi:hypothetical protein
VTINLPIDSSISKPSSTEMLRPSLIRLFSVLLLATGLSVASNDASAQDSGVILGMRYDTRIQRALPYYAGDADSLRQPAYYSLFIARRGDSIQIEAQVDDLIIPQGNGFRHAGTRRSVYNNWVEDFVWTARPGERPQVPGIQAFNGEYCEGYREQRLLFAGPTHLGIEQRTAGYCDGSAYPWHSSTLAVVPVDSTAHTGLDIGRVVGERAFRTFNEEAARTAERIARQRGEEIYFERADGANWSIKRDRGRWVVVGRVNLSDLPAVVDNVDIVLPIDAPRRIVDRNEPGLQWDAVRRAVADATDFFTSPRGDFVVIQRPGRIVVHFVEDGRIGRRAADVRLRANSTPVLARWASGDRLSQWTREFNEALISSREGRTTR